MSRLLDQARHSTGTLDLLAAGAYLATVVNVQDPSSLNRVQVRVFNVDGVTDQDAPVWARVAVPFAGDKRGAFFIPNVGDEVLVIYLNGDTRFPVVVGGLWNGTDHAPDQFGGDGTKVDRWTITGTAGSKIAIIEDSQGPTIQFTTPGGLTGKMSDSSASIEFSDALGSSVKIDSSGVTINTPSAFTVSASSVSITTPTMSVSAAMSNFAGVVKCIVAQAVTIIGTTYTPGAGNVW